jgi:tetrahydromethanopterin S-methyltransferase subunit B
MMTSDSFDLPVAALRPAEKILKEIETAGSMILAVKYGAKAHGFVIGLTCVGSITEEQGEVLILQFDRATERKLRELSI